MIKISIEKEELEAIKATQNDSNFCYNEHSINYGNIDKAKEANLIGIIGEYLFKKMYPSAVKRQSTHFDFVHNNETIDVKMRTMNLEPKSHFKFNIPVYQVENQNCDKYAFFYINKDLTTVYYFGIIRKDDFIKFSKIFKKGESEENNGFIYKIDSMSLEIGVLKKYATI